MGASARYVPIIFTAQGDQAFNVIQKMTSAFQDLDDKSERAGNRGLKNVFIQADLAGRAIAAGTREVVEAAREYLQFGRELANLDTLLDRNSNLTSIRDGLLDLDPYLGQTSELARGMYQALSSGVDAEDGLDAITDSAKAARAGLASTFETVDMGTSVMASFNLQGKDLASIYDKAFETVKRGKVEFPQLAANIGQVSSFAAEAGVSIDEMFAAVATGSRTTRPAQVIEGLRTALANIVKPSEQAKELAQKLGIEFSASALKSKGFAQFLNEVSAATQGDIDKLAVLFGDVQGLNVVLKLTGANSKQFADDLRGIAAASGTVDEAFEKQKQSAAAQWDAFKVSIQQGVIKTLLFLEPLLKGGLALLTNYPGKLAAVAVAVLGLAAAYKVYNSQLTISTLLQSPLIKGLQNVIFWMVHFRTALTETRTALTALAGWAGLLILLGTLVSSLVSFESATEAAAKITREQVQAQGESLKTTSANIAAVQGLTKAQSLSAAEHERMNSIIATLDPSTQSYIKAIDDEKLKVQELTRALQQKIEADKDVLRSEQIVFAASIVQTDRQIAKQQELIDKFKELKRQEEERIAYAAKEGLPVPTGATNNILGSAQSIQTANEKIKELNPTLSENTVKLALSTRALGQTKEEMLATFRAAGIGESSLKILGDAYDRVTGSTNNASATTLKMIPLLGWLAGAVDNTTASVRGLNNELAELGKADKERIDKAVLDIARRAKDRADAQRMAREAMKNDSQLQQSVKETQRIKETTEGARSQFEPSTRSAGGGGSKTKTDPGKQALDSYRDGLRDLRLELQFFGQNTRRAAVEQEYLKVKTDELKAAQLSQLQTLHQEKLAVAEQLEQKEAQKKAADELKRLNEEMGRAVEQSRDSIFELNATSENGRTHLEQFNFWLSKQSEEFRGNKEAIDQARAAMREWDAAEERVRIRREREQRIKAFDDAGAGAIRDLQQQLRDLKSLDGPDELDRIFGSLETIGDVKLPVGSFDSVLNLIRQLDAAGRDSEINLETLAANIQAVFTAAGVDLGPNDALFEKSKQIAQAVLLSRELSAQTTPLAQETRALNQEFQRLQQEVPVAAQTASLRFRNAWQAAINDVKLADIEAVESQIASQVRLADATVLHSEQVRASVLDHLARQKTVTEGFADSIISVYDRISGALDRGIDKLLGKLGILNEFVKSIVHQLLNRVFQKFLDALLGPSVGGGAGGSGGGGGGGGWLSGVFNWIGNIFNPTKSNKGAATAAMAAASGGSVSGPGGGGSFIPGVGFSDGLALPNTGGGITAPQSLSDIAAKQSQIASAIHEAGHTGAAATGAGAAGKFSLSKYGQQLAQMAPLLGLSLGANLGGNSVGGQILGSIGGLLGGVLAEGLLFGVGATSSVSSVTSGVWGALGSLGFSAAGAIATLGLGTVALLVGAHLLKRNKVRRQEEGLRDKAILDSFAQLDELLKQVNADKIDGTSAVAAAMNVRQNYVEQMSQLKDSKTRRHALQDVSRLDLRINQIKAAAERQKVRKDIDDRLVPEFRDGGAVWRRFADGGTFLPQYADELLPHRPLGLTPGPYTRTDPYHARFDGNEVILAPKHWKPIKPVLKALGVPGFKDGGAVSGSTSSSSGGGGLLPNLSVEVHNHIGEEDEEDRTEVILRVLDGPEAGKIIAKKSLSAIRHRAGG